MCSFNFRDLLISFLQHWNEFSLVCDYKITMIYIDMFKFLLHICQCQTLPSFLFCWMLLKCPFAPVCEGYYLFYVLFRNHNDLPFVPSSKHGFLIQSQFFIIFLLCHFSFFHVFFFYKNLFFVAIFFLFSLMCRCLSIVFVVLHFFHLEHHVFFQFTKFLLFFLLAYTISFSFSTCFFKKFNVP
jgi:hypothetical protein